MHNEEEIALYGHRYNKIGEVISFKKWWDLAGNDDYCRIARDKMDRVLICTEWTGKDYFEGMRNSPPLIFLTEIFLGRTQIATFYYNNQIEASHNHQKMVFLHEQKALLNYLGVNDER